MPAQIDPNSLANYFRNLGEGLQIGVSDIPGTNDFWITAWDPYEMNRKDFDPVHARIRRYEGGYGLVTPSGTQYMLPPTLIVPEQPSASELITDPNQLLANLIGAGIRHPYGLFGALTEGYEKFNVAGTTGMVTTTAPESLQQKYQRDLVNVFFPGAETYEEITTREEGMMKLVRGGEGPIWDYLRGFEIEKEQGARVKGTYGYNQLQRWGLAGQLPPVYGGTAVTERPEASKHINVNRWFRDLATPLAAGGRPMVPEQVRYAPGVVEAGAESLLQAGHYGVVQATAILPGETTPRTLISGLGVYGDVGYPGGGLAAWPQGMTGAGAYLPKVVDLPVDDARRLLQPTEKGIKPLMFTRSVQTAMQGGPARYIPPEDEGRVGTFMDRPLMMQAGSGGMYLQGVTMYIPRFVSTTGEFRREIDTIGSAAELEQWKSSAEYALQLSEFLGISVIPQGGRPDPYLVFSSYTPANISLKSGGVKVGGIEMPPQLLDVGGGMNIQPSLITGEVKSLASAFMGGFATVPRRTQIEMLQTGLSPELAEWARQQPAGPLQLEELVQQYGGITGEPTTAPELFQTLLQGLLQDPANLGKFGVGTAPTWFRGADVSAETRTLYMQSEVQALQRMIAPRLQEMGIASYRKDALVRAQRIAEAANRFEPILGSPGMFTHERYLPDALIMPHGISPVVEYAGGLTANYEALKSLAIDYPEIAQRLNLDVTRTGATPYDSPSLKSWREVENMYRYNLSARQGRTFQMEGSYELLPSVAEQALARLPAIKDLPLEEQYDALKSLELEEGLTLGQVGMLYGSQSGFHMVGPGVLKGLEHEDVLGTSIARITQSYARSLSGFLSAELAGSQSSAKFEASLALYGPKSSFGSRITDVFEAGGDLTKKLYGRQIPGYFGGKYQVNPALQPHEVYLSQQEFRRALRTLKKQPALWEEYQKNLPQFRRQGYIPSVTWRYPQLAGLGMTRLLTPEITPRSRLKQLGVNRWMPQSVLVSPYWSRARVGDWDIDPGTGFIVPFMPEGRAEELLNMSDAQAAQHYDAYFRNQFPDPALQEQFDVELESARDRYANLSDELIETAGATSDVNAIIKLLSTGKGPSQQLLEGLGVARRPVTGLQAEAEIENLSKRSMGGTYDIGRWLEAGAAGLFGGEDVLQRSFAGRVGIYQMALDRLITALTPVENMLSTVRFYSKEVSDPRVPGGITRSYSMRAKTEEGKDWPDFWRWTGFPGDDPALGWRLSDIAAGIASTEAIPNKLLAGMLAFGREDEALEAMGDATGAERGIRLVTKGILTQGNAMQAPMIRALMVNAARGTADKLVRGEISESEFMGMAFPIGADRTANLQQLLESPEYLATQGVFQMLKRKQMPIHRFGQIAELLKEIPEDERSYAAQAFIGIAERSGITRSREILRKRREERLLYESEEYIGARPVTGGGGGRPPRPPRPTAEGFDDDEGGDGGQRGGGGDWSASDKRWFEDFMNRAIRGMRNVYPASRTTPAVVSSKVRGAYASLRMFQESPEYQGLMGELRGKVEEVTGIEVGQGDEFQSLMNLLGSGHEGVAGLVQGILSPFKARFTAAAGIQRQAQTAAGLIHQAPGTVKEYSGLVRMAVEESTPLGAQLMDMAAISGIYKGMPTATGGRSGGVGAALTPDIVTQGIREFQQDPIFRKLTEDVAAITTAGGPDVAGRVREMFQDNPEYMGIVRRVMQARRLGSRYKVEGIEDIDAVAKAIETGQVPVPREGDTLNLIDPESLKEFNDLMGKIETAVKATNVAHEKYLQNQKDDKAYKEFQSAALTEERYLQAATRVRAAEAYRSLEGDETEGATIRRAQLAQAMRTAGEREVGAIRAQQELEGGPTFEGVSRGMRRIFGGFGLFYMGHLARLGFGQFQQGYGEGIAMEQAAYGAAGPYAGLGLGVPESPEQYYQNQLAMGGTVFRGLRTAQAGMAGTAFSDIAGLGLAGIGGGLIGAHVAGGLASAGLIGGAAVAPITIAAGLGVAGISAAGTIASYRQFPERVGLQMAVSRLRGQELIDNLQPTPSVEGFLDFWQAIGLGTSRNIQAFMGGDVVKEEEERIMGATQQVQRGQRIIGGPRLQIPAMQGLVGADERFQYMPPEIVFQQQQRLAYAGEYGSGALRLFSEAAMLGIPYEQYSAMALKVQGKPVSTESVVRYQQGLMQQGYTAPMLAEAQGGVELMSEIGGGYRLFGNIPGRPGIGGLGEPGGRPFEMYARRLDQQPAQVQQAWMLQAQIQANIAAQGGAGVAPSISGVDATPEGILTSQMLLGIQSRASQFQATIMQQYGIDSERAARFWHTYTGGTPQQRNLMGGLIQRAPWAVAQASQMPGGAGLSGAVTMDIGMGGDITGLPLFATSMWQGAIPPTQTAANIWGGDWQGGDVSGIRGAMVSGFTTAGGRELFGFRAANAYMADLSYQSQMASLGTARAQQNLQFAFQTGVGIGDYAGIVNPQTGQPFGFNTGTFGFTSPGGAFTSAGGGMWGAQDAIRNLGYAQQTYGFQMQQQQFDISGRQFQENQAFNYTGMMLNQQATYANWAYQDQTRALQWAWTQEDYAENVRFLSGRQRKTAERQMQRQTIMYGIEGEQIDTVRGFEEERMRMERERFELNQQHNEELRKLQQEQMDAQKVFFEERKRLEEEQNDLQRAYQTEQMELQKQATDAQAMYAELMKAAREDLEAASQYQEDVIAKEEYRRQAELDWMDDVLELLEKIAGVTSPFKTEFPIQGGPSYTPPSSYSPYSSTTITNGQLQAQQPTTVVVNIGNERLGQYVISNVREELEAA